MNIFGNIIWYVAKQKSHVVLVAATVSRKAPLIKRRLETDFLKILVGNAFFFLRTTVFVSQFLIEVNISSEPL